MTAGTATKTDRRPDIDWLRVLATFVVLFFHCARFFNDEDWHVKNGVLSEGMSIFVWFTSRWMMPLFFLLSAYGAYFALERRAPRAYLRERVRRLLVPLVFGTFVLIPPQVYVERITHGQFSGSFFEFFPKYFEGLYGFGGNFAWMGLHLWYLEALFVFSVIALPLFGLLRARRSRVAILRLASLLSRPGALYLLIVPVWLIEIVANDNAEGIGRRDFGGWSLLTYFVVFAAGYLVAASGRPLNDAIARHRFVSLALGVGFSALGYAIDQPIGLVALSLLRACTMISWLLAILGFAARHLSFEKPVLGQANEAVLPFYILHQTVIVVIAFFLISWNAPVFVKYAVLVTSAFAGIVATYLLIVKRVVFVQILFGMKPKKRGRQA